MRSRARSIGANLRRRTDERPGEVHRINREPVRIARRSVREAQTLVRNARRGSNGSMIARRAVNAPTLPHTPPGR